VGIVLVYQLTFVVACTILDERCIQQHCRDVCFCCLVHDKQVLNRAVSHEPLRQQFITWYATFLLRPAVKVMVLLSFTLFAASKLEQNFIFVDIVLEDSYIKDFSNAYDAYMEESF